MVFSSFGECRSASLARRSGRRVVGARARLGMPVMRAKRKPAGWSTRQAFLPEGWTSRRTRAWRLYTNHSTESTHGTALAVRAAESSSRSRLMSRSPTEQAENKRPGGLGLPGLWNSGGQASGREGSRKTVRRNKGATHPPQLCGSSIRLARSGTASSNSRRFGR